MEISESLLNAWIDLTERIRGNRMLRLMSLNEMLICGHILRDGGDTGLSSKELCDKVRLLKSQTHKVLTEMESNGLIERRRSETDARKIYILLTAQGREMYSKEHARIIKLVDMIISELGEEQANDLTRLVNKAIDTADRIRMEEMA